MNQKNTLKVSFDDTFRIFITCTITLTVLKLSGEISWPWWAVTLMTWFPFVGIVALIILSLSASLAIKTWRALKDELSTPACNADCQQGRACQETTQRQFPPTFFFDSNSCYGSVSTPEDWAVMRSWFKQYEINVDPDSIYQAKLSIRSPLDLNKIDEESYPSFGFWPEHQGNITLGEYFDAFGVDRKSGMATK